MQSRVYFALKNLTEFYREPDLSKAIIFSINHMAGSIGECEERTLRCEEMHKSLLGKQSSTTANLSLAVK